MKLGKKTQHEHWDQDVKNKLGDNSCTRNESWKETKQELWDKSDKWRMWFLGDPHKSWNIKGILKQEFTGYKGFSPSAATHSVFQAHVCSYHNIISKNKISLNANILRSIPASSDMNCPCAALRASTTYRSTGSPWSLAIARTVFKFLTKQNCLSYINFNNLIIHHSSICRWWNHVIIVYLLLQKQKC